MVIIFLEARIDKREIGHGYARNREPDHCPLVEEFFTVAPAIVEPKTRYGLEGSEARLGEALCETSQGSLFC